MSRLSRALVALLFFCLAVALPACDSGTDNPGGGSLDGYTGNTSLLGVWEALDDAGQPYVGYMEFFEISYSASSRSTTIRELSRSDGDTCYSLDLFPVSALTPTTLVFDGDGPPGYYSVDSNRLAIYDRGNTTGTGSPELTFRRSSRAAASFTPVCP